MDIPIDTPINIIYLFKERGFELRLALFSARYSETWDQLESVVNNLRELNMIPSIPARQSATWRYLRLLNIPYTIHSCYDVRMQDIPDLIQDGYGDMLMREGHKSIDIRIMLESGYSPSEELFQEVIDSYPHVDELEILLTLPLPWTDELYYRVALRLDNLVSYLVNIPNDEYYRPFWNGLYRYINHNPEHRLRPYLVEWIHNQDFSTVSIGYLDSLAEYVALIFQDPVGDGKNPLDRFCELIERSYIRYCYDPRLFHYWEQLSQPNNRGKLRRLARHNSLIIEYLDYKGLYHNYNLTKESNNWRLIRAITHGEKDWRDLPVDHPLHQLMRSLNTKSARRKI